MQWNALNQKSKNVDTGVGVCRDAVTTVSEFAQNCGFSKDQLRMESIKTAGAGHVVTVIRGSDGKNYNINWSEFFSKDSAPAGSNPILNVVNVSTGVTVSSYDADGNLKSNRLTEVGAIMKANAGGDVSDLNYLPNFNQMRLAAKKVSLNAFYGDTAAGDNLKGIGIVGDDLKGMRGMTVGMSFATNKRFLTKASDGSDIELDQKLILFSLQGDVLDNTSLEIFSTDGSKLILNPTLDVDMNFAYYVNEVTGRSKKTNIEGKMIFSPGGDLAYYDSQRGVTMGVAAKADFMIGSNSTINERGTPGEKGKLSSLPTFTGYQLNGSARFEVGNSNDIGVYSTRTSDYFQTSNTVGASIEQAHGPHVSNFTMGYTKVNDGRGDYTSTSRLLKFNAYHLRDEGRWRLSVDGMLEPTSDEYRLMTGLSYRFK